eukprot:178284_1
MLLLNSYDLHPYHMPIILIIISVCNCIHFQIHIDLHYPYYFVNYIVPYLMLNLLYTFLSFCVCKRIGSFRIFSSLSFCFCNISIEFLLLFILTPPPTTAA